MAKKSMIARELKREKLVHKFAQRRAQLRAQAKDSNLEWDERQAAVVALQKQPRDASPSRRRNRCRMTGRPRGYYRRFGLSRSRLREVIMEGAAPGASKASW